MSRLGAGLLSLAVFVWPASALQAQELLDEPIEDLAAQEEVRSAVETAITNYLAAKGGTRIDVALEGILSLLPYGDAVVPYLAAELEQEDYLSFDFTTWALGFLEAPSAAVALREAIERAEATPGAASLARKAWSCWALGLHGEIDALKLVNEGTHQAARFPMHSQTTVIEAIALQTAPESVPVLLEQLATWGDSETMQRYRRFVARALRRLAHPASEPRLISIIEESDEPALRAQAADALRSIASPDSIAALHVALKDPDPGPRRAAAFALKWMDQPGDVEKLLVQLETEEDLRTREALYAVIAAHARADQLPRLLAQWNRPDTQDRRHLLGAIANKEGKEVNKVLIEALDDPERAVALTAIGPLANSRKKASTDKLLEALDTTGRWNFVRVIAQAVGAEGLKSLAPALTRRLLDAAQQDTRKYPGVPSAASELAQALVDLRYTAAISKLRRGRETAKDPKMAELLDATVDALELLRENGKQISKWVPLLRDPDPAHARLARGRLAELGGVQAAAALVEAYDDVDILARLDTLLKLEQMDTPAVRGLLRRLLLEPESYTQERRGEGRTAAWIARCFGDDEMFDLLAEAIRLHEGRYAEQLIYAAAVNPEKTLPLIRQYRLTRLRYLGLNLGYEQEVLDWIARRIENGLPIGRYDRPPSRLVVR